MHSGNFGYTIWKLWEYNQISLRDMRNQFNTFPNPQTGEKPAREIQFPLEHKLVRIFFPNVHLAMHCVCPQILKSDINYWAHDT